MKVFWLLNVMFALSQVALATEDLVGPTDGFLQIPQGSKLVAKKNIEVPPRVSVLFFQGGKSFYEASKIVDQPFCSISFSSSGSDRIMAAGTSFTIGSTGGSNYSYDYSGRRYDVYLYLQDNGGSSVICYGKTTDTSSYLPSIADFKALVADSFDLTLAGESPWSVSDLSENLIGDKDLFYYLPTDSTITTLLPINVQPRSSYVFFQGGKVVNNPAQLVTNAPFCSFYVNSSGLDRVLPTKTTLHISDSGNSSSTSSYGGNRYSVTLGLSDQGFYSVGCYSAVGATAYSPTIAEIKTLMAAVMTIQVAGETPWNPTLR